MAKMEVGRRFQKLVIIEVLSNRMFRVRCDCGTEKEINGANLHKVTGCGCVRAEVTGARYRRHGLSRTRIHRIWSNMHDRCYREKNPQFKDYGGRGIRVDERWHIFENFLEDMGDMPTPVPGKPKSVTIDRIDNDKGYGPGNCRWETDWSKQCQNRRSTKKNSRS